MSDSAGRAGVQAHVADEHRQLVADGSGAAIGVAASHEILGWFPARVGRSAGSAAALFGLPLTGYSRRAVRPVPWGAGRRPLN